MHAFISQRFIMMRYLNIKLLKYFSNNTSFMSKRIPLLSLKLESFNSHSQWKMLPFLNRKQNFSSLPNVFVQRHWMHQTQWTEEAFLSMLSSHVFLNKFNLKECHYWFCSGNILLWNATKDQMNSFAFALNFNNEKYNYIVQVV